jgi:hypothetical protein
LALLKAAVRRAVEGRLILKPQPTYSPKLNPQERIWKWLPRVVTHNQWFESLPKDVKAVRDLFCDLAGGNEQIQHLCAVKTPGFFSCITVGGMGKLTTTYTSLLNPRELL